MEGLRWVSVFGLSEQAVQPTRSLGNRFEPEIGGSAFESMSGTRRGVSLLRRNQPSELSEYHWQLIRKILQHAIEKKLSRVGLQLSEDVQPLWLEKQLLVKRFCGHDVRF